MLQAAGLGLAVTIMHLDDHTGSQPSVVLISSNRFIHGFGFLCLDSWIWVLGVESMVLIRDWVSFVCMH